MRRTHLAALRGLSAGVVAAALLACAAFREPEPEPIQVSSRHLLDQRDSLTGKVASVSGYLVSAETIADRICLKVLVDETLRTAPSLFIESRRREAELGPAWPLAGGYTEERQRELRVAMETDSDAVVIQACKLPPTDGNERAIRHALEWLAPLQKPERVENAPDIASLRRELQFFYVERSRAYGWTPLSGEEVVITGTLVDGSTASEAEILAGIDLVPTLVGIHDPQRGRWLVIDLSFDDSIAKEMTLGVFRSHLPRLFKGTTRAALKTLTP